MPRYPEYQIHSLDTHGYGRIIQTIDGKFYDGWGNTVTFTLFGKEVSINVEGAGTDSTDGGNINITNNNNNNTNNTDLFQDLQNQINDLTKIIDDQKKAIESQKTTIESQNTVPTGTIIMWGGSEAGIPSGWKLCDGSTLYDVNAKLRQQLKDQGNPFGEWQGSPLLPDLRERFIVGAGKGKNNGENNSTVIGNAYSVGDKGGIINNVLNVSNIPEHQHYLPKFIESVTKTTGKVQDGSWSQKEFVTGVTGNKPGYYLETLGAGDYVSGYDFWNPDKERSYGISNPLSPGWYRDYGNQKADSNGWVENDPQSIENRPPYFALCYIIKL